MNYLAAFDKTAAGYLADIDDFRERINTYWRISDTGSERER